MSEDDLDKAKTDKEKYLENIKDLKKELAKVQDEIKEKGSSYELKKKKCEILLQIQSGHDTTKMSEACSKQKANYMYSYYSDEWSKI